MDAQNLLLRIYGERTDGQWSLINLEFSLAAQAETLEEAKAILASQIKEYVADAITGEDRAHAGQLLSRRAPLKYWVKYWLGMLRCRVMGRSSNSEKAFVETLPLVPA